MSKHLVVDNGSYNIKAGFQGAEPLKVHNIISKTKDGAIYIGNEYLKQTNNYSGIIFRRPYDQGHLVSWETEKPVWDYMFDKFEFDASETHLTLTETPFQLPQLSINTDLIVFEEYGFSEYYRCIPASLVPWLGSDKSDYMLVIDSGFYATWIIPVIYQKVYWKGVKKLPIGGKLLNGLLRELISFRHYDIADEPILINTIKEKTCFVAQDFNSALRKRNNYMTEFILPDFKTTTTGYVKTDSSKVPPDAQSLRLLDERFTVPESFYHPEIIFDNNSTNSSLLQSTPMKNLVDLAVESIMSCPEVVRPLLSSNISVVGGTACLPNFESRLLSELRRELPLDWCVKSISTDIPKDEAAWNGGLNLSSDEVIEKVSITKQDYFEHGANWCQKQFGFKNL
ncbi:uncharacterized protein PRCAT00003043001 [Priceomyces carsonii]|uniref:uncharacterized protein n=1 Tax=Priceomyces carsonii TaxID=28549 RepID=UPI002EDA76D1|nr:unnamed protein product [Priceomyces carsonii]